MFRHGFLKSFSSSSKKKSLFSKFSFFQTFKHFFSSKNNFFVPKHALLPLFKYFLHRLLCFDSCVINSNTLRNLIRKFISIIDYLFYIYIYKIVYSNVLLYKRVGQDRKAKGSWFDWHGDREIAFDPTCR